MQGRGRAKDCRHRIINSGVQREVGEEGRKGKGNQRGNGEELPSEQEHSKKGQSSCERVWPQLSVCFPFSILNELGNLQCNMSSLFLLLFLLGNNLCEANNVGFFDIWVCKLHVNIHQIG